MKGTLICLNAITIALVTIIILPYSLRAQSSVDQNDLMRKYWNMREKLRKYFIVYNTENGGGIPAAGATYPFEGVPQEELPLSGEPGTFSNSGHIGWGDGTTRIGDYLVVLATEYSLLNGSLKDHPENVDAIKGTLSEIYYVLYAIDRIDLNANLFLSNGSASKKAKPDGYMLRDDVGNTLMEANWNYYCSPWNGYRYNIDPKDNLNFNTCNSWDPDSKTYKSDNTMSEDQFISVMQGLCFIIKYVDCLDIIQPTAQDPVFTNAQGKKLTVQEKAMDRLGVMMNYMLTQHSLNLKGADLYDYIAAINYLLNKDIYCAAGILYNHASFVGARLGGTAGAVIGGIAGLIFKLGLHGHNDITLKSNFLLPNPVTGEDESHGGGWPQYHSWGLTTAADRFLNQSVKYTDGSLRLNLKYAQYNKVVKPFADLFGVDCSSLLDLNLGLSQTPPSNDFSKFYKSISTGINGPTMGDLSRLPNSYGLPQQIFQSLPGIAGLPCDLLSFKYPDISIDGKWYNPTSWEFKFGWNNFEINNPYCKNYQRRLSVQLATLGNTWDINTVHDYCNSNYNLEAMELMHNALNSSTVLINNQHVEDILSGAPCNGPYNFDGRFVNGSLQSGYWSYNNNSNTASSSGTQYGSGGWCTGARWEADNTSGPNTIMPESDIHSESNGLDYMMLYNLYRLVFKGSVSFPAYVNNSCPCNQTFTFTSNPNTLSAKTNDLLIPATCGAIYWNTTNGILDPKGDYAKEYSLRNSNGSYAWDVKLKVVDNYNNPTTVYLYRKFGGWVRFGVGIKEFLLDNLTIPNGKNLEVETDLVVCNNSGSTTQVNIKNGGRIDILPDATTTSNTIFSLAPSHSSLTVRGNNKLEIESGGLLTINDNAQLIIAPGATLYLDAGSSLVAKGPNARIIIRPGGKIVYDQTASIELSNKAVLEIQGEVMLKNNSVFTFTTDYAISGNTPGWVLVNNYTNIPYTFKPNATGDFCSIEFNNIDRKILMLQIEGGNLTIPVTIDHIHITTCSVLGGDAAHLVIEKGKYLFERVHFSGSPNSSFGGVIIYNSGSSSTADIFINHCFFEYCFTAISTFGDPHYFLNPNLNIPTLGVRNTTMQYCAYGIATDKVVLDLQSVGIHNCGDGILIEGDNYPHYIYNCIIENCGNIGIETYGGSSQIYVKGCEINYNGAGIFVNENNTINIGCSQISYNNDKDMTVEDKDFYTHFAYGGGTGTILIDPNYDRRSSVEGGVVLTENATLNMGLPYSDLGHNILTGNTGDRNESLDINGVPFLHAPGSSLNFLGYLQTVPWPGKYVAVPYTNIHIDGGYNNFANDPNCNTNGSYNSCNMSIMGILDDGTNSSQDYCAAWNNPNNGCSCISKTIQADYNQFNNNTGTYGTSPVFQSYSNKDWNGDYNLMSYQCEKLIHNFHGNDWITQEIFTINAPHPASGTCGNGGSNLGGGGYTNSGALNLYNISEVKNAYPSSTNPLIQCTTCGSVTTTSNGTMQLNDAVILGLSKVEQNQNANAVSLFKDILSNYVSSNSGAEQIMMAMAYNGMKKALTMGIVQKQISDTDTVKMNFILAIQQRVLDTLKDTLTKGMLLKMDMANTYRIFNKPEQALSIYNTLSPGGYLQKKVNYWKSHLTAEIQLKNGSITPAQYDRIRFSIRPPYPPKQLLRPSVLYGVNLLNKKDSIIDTCNTSTITHIYKALGKRIDTTSSITYSWKVYGAIKDSLLPSLGDTSRIIVTWKRDTAFRSIIVKDIYQGISYYDTLNLIAKDTVLSITASANRDTICKGDSIQLSTNVQYNYGGSLSYSWSPGNKSTSTFKVAPTNNTTYEVVVNNTDGCPKSAYVNINIKPQPVGHFKAVYSDTICIGDTSILSIALKGTPPWSFTWSNGSSTSVVSRLFDSVYVLKVSPRHKTVYKIISLNDSFCTAHILDSTTMFVDSFPQAIINPITRTICDGDSVKLHDSVLAKGPWTLTLSDNSMFTGSGNTSSDIWVKPHLTTVYKVQYLSTGLCTNYKSIDSAIVNVNVQPTSHISGSNILCKGDSAVLSVTLTGHKPWNLSWTDGTLTHNIAAVRVSPFTFKVSPFTSTTYRIKNLSDSLCFALDSNNYSSAFIEVRNAPTALITGTSNVCLGDSTLLSISLAGISPFNFVWSDGTQSHTVSSVITSPYNFKVAPSSTTTYTIASLSNTQCTVGNNNFSGSAVVTVHSLPCPTDSCTHPSDTLHGNAHICLGDSASINVSLVGLAPWTITLQDNKGTSKTISGIRYSPYTFKVSPSDNTIYTVASLTDSLCSAKSINNIGSAAITVLPRPTSYINDSTIICNGDNDSIAVKLTGTPPWSITWSDGSSNHTVSGIHSNPYTLVVAPNITTTYRIVGVNDSLCSADSAHMVGNAFAMVNPRPTASVSGSTSLCYGDSTFVLFGLTGNGPWKITWNNGYMSATAYSDTALYKLKQFPAVKDTFRVTSLNDVNCYAQSSDLTGMAILNTAAKLSATITTVDTICKTDSASVLVRLTGLSAKTFTWYDGTSHTISGVTDSIYSLKVAPIQNTSYTITELHNSGCSALKSDLKGIAFVNVDSISSLMADRDTICSGDSVSVIVKLKGTPPWTLTWTDGTTNHTVSGILSSPFIFLVQPTVSTTYSISTLNDAKCAASSSDMVGNSIVTIHSKPTFAVSGTNPICNGSSSTLSIALTGNAPWSLNWTDGLHNYSIPGILTSPYTFSVSPVSNVSYKVTSLNDKYCNSLPNDTTDSIAVIVNARPTSVVSGTTTICNGGSTTISVALTGTQPWALTWYDGSSSHNVTGITTSPYTFGVSPTANTTYTLTALSDANCTSQSGDRTGSAVVTVNARPTSVVSGTATICNGGSTTISVALTGVQPWALTWYDGSSSHNVTGITTSPYTFNVSPTANTTYTVTTLTDANCTSQSGDRTGNALISVNTRPTSAVSGTATICNGGSTTISVALTGAQPWALTWYDGSSSHNVTGITTSPYTFNVSPTANATYTVTALSDVNCTSQSGDMTGSAFVTVNARPTSVVSGTATVCNGGSTTISVALSGTQPWALTWYDGSSHNITGITTSPYTFSVSPTENTTYTVTAISDANCTSQSGDRTGSAVVTVNARPTSIVSGTATICNGGSTTISVALTGTQPWALSWYDGSSSHSVTGITASPYTFSVSPTVNTTYSVTALSDANCTSQAGDRTGSGVVTVNTRPTSLVSGTATICSGGSSNISVALTGAQPWALTWYDGSSSHNVTGITTSPYTFSVSPTANTTYTVTAISDANCTSLSGDRAGNAIVTVNARPTSNLTGSTTICSGSNTTLSIALTGAQPWAFTWNDGSNHTVSGITTSPYNIIVSPTITTTYSVTALSDANCTAQTGDRTGSAVVTTNTRPAASFTPSTSLSICGGTATLPISLSGASPWTLIYSDGTVSRTISTSSTTYNLVVTPLVTTTYTILSLTDNNTCTAALTSNYSRAVVQQGAFPGVITPSPSITCSGGKQTFTLVGCNGNHVQWERNRNEFGTDTSWRNFGVNADTATLSGITDTTYIRALVQDSSGCTVITSSITADVTKDVRVKLTSGTITSNSLNLIWTPMLGAHIYTIYYKIAGAGTWSALTTSNTSYTLSSLSSCTQYTVYVGPDSSKCNPGGNNNSDTLNLYTLASASLTLTLSASGSNVAASWNAGTGPYKFHWCSSLNYPTFTTVTVTGSTSYTMTTPTAGSSIIAYVEDNGIACTAPVNFTYYNVSGGSCTATAPVLNSVTSTGNSVTLNWTGYNGTGSNIYLLHLVNVINGSGNSYTTSASPYTLNATPGTCYYAWVNNRCGSNFGYSSAVVKICTPSGCPIPLNLELSNASCHGFSATWNSVSCASSYQLKYGPLGSSLNSYQYTGTAANLSGLNANTWYNVYVATNTLADGSSVYSTVETIKTLNTGCKDDGETRPTVDFVELNTISIYPNPNTGTFIVKMQTLCDNPTATLELLDMVGQVIGTQTVANNNGIIQANISNELLVNGLYMVRIRCGDIVRTGKVQVVK